MFGVVREAGWSNAAAAYASVEAEDAQHAEDVETALPD